MKKIFITVLVVAVVAAIGYGAYAFFGKKGTQQKKEAYSLAPVKSMLPRVLYLTTGTSEGNGEIAEGVSIAIQEFTKNGAFVWLGTREYLLQPDKMAEFNIIVSPTSFNYHDGDKKYSLTYMSEKEMENLKDWVSSGGILVAEENVGRNTIDELDRLSLGGELNHNNWPLSEVFGFRMIENDMIGFIMADKGSGIWQGTIKDTLTEDEWSLVPVEITSPDAKVYAEWIRGNELYPAVIENDFGEGKAIFLTSTYMLHPSNDGGISSVEQIEKFYDHVMSTLPGQGEYKFSVNPWPGGYSSAACLSFNSSGNDAVIGSLITLLKEQDVPATFVIDSSTSIVSRDAMSESSMIELVSGLSMKKDFTYASLSENSKAIIEIEQATGLKFSGIRFPFRSANYAGLTYASDNGYLFDMSVGIDHLSGYSGCVFPYNIPLARDSFYKSTGMLELCQMMRNDYEFFQMPDSLDEYTQEMQIEQAALFTQYLRDFFQFVVKRNGGLMVFTGNPDYTAHSEFTLKSITDLIDLLKNANVWIAHGEQIVKFRNSLKTLSVEAISEGNKITLKFNYPAGAEIKNLSIRTNRKPQDISFGRELTLKEFDGVYYIVMDVMNGDELRFTL